MADMSEFGFFSGDPTFKWLSVPGETDRDMELLDDFWYIDPDGRKWLARKGSIVNGASIPKTFWDRIGPPFVGNYRRASIVHDVECDSKTSPHGVVHRMFYHACRAGGVSRTKALVMYAAVAGFGPKWEISGFESAARGGIAKGAQNVQPEADFALQERYMPNLESLIESSESTSLDDIDAYINQNIR